MSMHSCARPDGWMCHCSTSPSPSLQDNKVLPSDVDQDRANKEGGLCRQAAGAGHGRDCRHHVRCVQQQQTGAAKCTGCSHGILHSLVYTDWWSRPEFVCYNLNIGSVIVAPAHDEVISLPHDMASGAGGSGGGGGGAGRKDEDGAKAGGEGEKSGGQERDEPSYTLRGFAHTGQLGSALKTRGSTAGIRAACYQQCGVAVPATLAQQTAGVAHISMLCSTPCFVIPCALKTPSACSFLCRRRPPGDPSGAVVRWRDQLAPGAHRRAGARGGCIYT